ncbi:MAG: diguanylate cyclase [Candidatus Solibacter usitatus]|nr:diguanylate cyclase [Candidatus Solibacter usitatus]
MVTVISRFRVRNGLEEQVRRAFLDRPRLVEKAAGFHGLEVLTDAADPSVFLLVTRWADQASFQAWHRSDAHHRSHQMMPPGLKLDAAFTSLTVGNSIEDPGGVHSLREAMQGQASAISQWLMESEAVLALLLAPDGAIRARNQWACRFFPPDPVNNPAQSIWHYLACSDAQPLRQRLLDGAQQDGRLLLNVAHEGRNPITLDVGLVRCNGATLLLATQEQRHDEQFQTEIVALSNDLSLMMRESARKNRELKEANETIERLARVDALTGLANRRTLNEAFAREIARADRIREHLSVIIADLDHFKSINDEYGHLAGDQVLAGAAAVFLSQSRPYDLAARYGGEEFVLLLPGTTAGGALVIAERIRKEVAELRFAGCPRQVTVSLGVASWMAGETSEELVARADAALYIAKGAGRNRVEAAAGVHV